MKILLALTIILSMGCATASHTRVYCPWEGAMTFDHDPGVRVANMKIDCTRLEDKSVSLTITISDKGISPGAAGALTAVGAIIGTIAAPGVGTVAGAGVGLAADIAVEALSKDNQTVAPLVVPEGDARIDAELFH